MGRQLVGRGDLLAAIRRFLAVEEELPGLLVLEGDPGIGKTTVWRAALEAAVTMGFAVLRCAPTEAEASLIYSGLADLVSEIDPGRLDSLPAPQRTAFEQVLLRADGPTSTIDPRALGAALLTLLEMPSGRRPTLLAVDDWQWLDSASRAAVGFAMRRVSAPVGMLATVRPGNPEVYGILDHDHVTRTTVGPLESRQLHRLLESRLQRTIPRTGFERIQRVSGGNPWFALELAHSFDFDGHLDPGFTLPDTLGQLVAAHLAKVNPAARDVLRAAAALADPRVEYILAAVDGDDQEKLLLLQDAEEAGLIRMQGVRVTFVHPLFASGILQEASDPELRNLHRRLARVVTDLEQRARHLALATVRAEPETVAVLDRAVAHARTHGAPAVAAEFLEHILRLGGESERRTLDLIGCRLDAGDIARARMLAEAASASMPAGPHRADVLRLLATIRLYDDSYAEAEQLLRKALSENGVVGVLRGRLLIEHGYVLANLGRILDARDLMAEAVAELEPLREPGLMACAVAGSAIARFLSGDGLDETARIRSLVLEDPDAPVPVMLRPGLVSGLLLAWSGRLDEGRATLREVRAQCLERGEESDVIYCAFYLGIFECWAGDLAAARLVADDSLERARHLDSRIALGTARATQAVAATYAGDLEEGRAGAQEALAIFQRGSCLSAMVWPAVTLGLAELSEGNNEAAARILGPLVDGALGMGYGEPTAAPFAADAAEALIGAGRLDEARDIVEHLQAQGHRLDRAWALATGGRCRAQLLAAEGALEASLTAVQDALDEHRKLQMPFELARTLVVLGQVQRRRRRKRASAEAFERALTIFDDMGARMWSERVRGELERGPARASSDTGLSPSERRVAEFAAEGHTNREVAQALCIHPKTVEAHLSRVYRKLGIGSRAELGRWMAETAATGD